MVLKYGAPKANPSFSRMPRGVLQTIGQSKVQRIVNTYDELVKAIAFFRSSGLGGQVVVGAHIRVADPITIPQPPPVPDAANRNTANLEITSAGGALLCDAGLSSAFVLPLYTGGGTQSASVSLSNLRILGESLNYSVSGFESLFALGAVGYGEISVNNCMLVSNRISVGAGGGLVDFLMVGSRMFDTGSVTDLVQSSSSGVVSSTIATALSAFGATGVTVIGCINFATTPGVNCSVASTGNL